MGVIGAFCIRRDPADLEECCQRKADQLTLVFSITP